MSEILVINEIYLSLQGESTFAGLPCVFIRLTACNLRCSYCDTAYAFTEGTKKPLEEIRAEVLKVAAPFHRSNQPAPLTLDLGPSTLRSIAVEAGSALRRLRSAEGSGLCGAATEDGRNLDAIPRLPLVELTGGEPLLQK